MARHGAAVLVVDDEILIRMILADYLLDGGYKVLEAANVDEALAVLDSGVPVDLVLSDVRMPGARDGLDLLDQVMASRPQLPVVLCSGTLAPSLAISRGAAAFVPKPFNMTQVDDALEKVLGMSANNDAGAAMSVLLVDSDVAVRLALTDYLRECGHAVIEAADTDEALVILGHGERPIDIVLCSVTVTGSLNGFGLAQWVRSKTPDVDVALAGTIEAAAHTAAVLCELGPRLKRPYEPQSVVAYIKQLRANRQRQGASD